MTHPNAAKGARWELSVRRYLDSQLGPRTVRRPAQEGYLDVGDLHVGPWTLQCKDEARHAFAGYVDDAEKQAVNALQPFGAAVVKRRQKGADRGYVVMSLETFARVLAAHSIPTP